MATSVLDNTKLTFTTNGSTIASRMTATADTLTLVGASSANIKLTGVAVPTANTDAVNKSYVDNLITGLKWKEPVIAATTGAGTLATDFENNDTLDGVTLVTGNRILIKNQASAVENGIYVVNASGAPTRADDLQAGDDAASVAVLVQQGSTNSDLGFLCNDDTGSAVVGTNNLTFVEFASSVVPPGGSDTQIQYNNSNSFGGVSGWTTNGTTDFVGADGSNLILGAGNDVILTHDGTHSKITSATGNFTVDNTNASGATINLLGSDDANTSFQVQNNSAASKFQVAGSGQVDIANNLDVSGGIDIDADNVALTIGAGADLSISHDGTNTTMTSATGDFIIDNTHPIGSTIVRTANDGITSDFQVQNDSGDFKFTVFGSGQVDIVNNLDVAGGIDIDADGQALTVGASADISLSHDGTDSLLTSTTGNFTLDNTNISGATINKLGSNTANASFQVQNEAAAVKLKVDGTGQVDIANNLDVSGGVDIDADNVALTVGAGADVSLSHNGTDSSLTSVTGNFNLVNSNATGKTINKIGSNTTATSFEVHNSSDVPVFTVAGSGQAYIAENLDVSGGVDINSDISALTLGDSADIEMAHDGTDSKLTNKTGNFTIDNTSATSSTIVMLGSDTSSTAFKVQNNSASDAIVVDGSGLVNIPALNRSAEPGNLGSTLKIDGTTFTDNTTASSGTVGGHAFVGIARPTLAAANTSITTTTAATLYIENAPAAGTNQTLTNSYAIHAPAGNILFGGDAFANTFNATSDVTLKTNINSLNNPLETVNKINGYSYNWKDQSVSQEEQWGVLAQQLEEAGLSHLVSDNGYNKTVNYLGLIPLLIESIKELNKKVN